MKRSNTRYNDLQILDGMRKPSDGSNRKVTARVNDVWKQAKDEQLERARKLLIEAHREGNLDEVYKLENDIRKYMEKQGYGRW